MLSRKGMIVKIVRDNVSDFLSHYFAAFHLSSIIIK